MRWWIRKAVTRAIAKNRPIGVLVHESEAISQMRRQTRVFQQEDTTPDEIAVAMGISYRVVIGCFNHRHS